MAKAKQISVSPASKKTGSKKVEADTPVESKFADRADESAVDDPVRMYLMQMGRIPLLTREEEVDAATKIDKARFEFRNTMLATDFMLKGAYDLLLKVSLKQLRLDRTIEVSVTNKAEKERIMKRIVPNPVSYTHLTLPTIYSV